MGKSSPKTPAPPDPVKTAAAQAAINKETAITQASLNRVDEYTPYGTSTWSQKSAPPSTREAIYGPDTQVAGHYEGGGGYVDEWNEGATGPGGQGQWVPGYTQKGGITGYKDVPGVYDPNDPNQRWTRTTTLDPAQQAIFDKQNTITNELNQVALDQVGRVGQSLATPFSYEGIVGPGSTAGARDAAGRVADISNTAYDYSGQPAAPSAQGITDAADAAAAGLAQPFNYAGLPAGATSAGSEAAVQRTTDAYGTPLNYDSAPAAPGADAAARQQVINSLYQQQTSRLDPRFAGELIQKETQLANSGIARGTQAFSGAMDDFYRGRNDAYQGAQNAAIQAGGAEQSRLFGLGSAARQNAIAEQNYLRALTGQEQGQLLEYEDQLAGLQDRIRVRSAQERLSEREVGLDEQTRLQAMRGVAFDAQGQERSRGIEEQDSLRNRALTEQQASYNMQSGLFGLDQQARQRAIEESAYLRNMPLNETAALMSGNQINNPQFGAAPQTGIANTDYSGLVSNNYAAQVSAANANTAAKSANTGAIIGGVATVGAAF